MACSTPNQYGVFLSEEQRQTLEELCHKGRAAAPEILHAQILLLSDQHRPQGKCPRSTIAELLGVHPNTVDRVRKRFAQQGETAAVRRKPRATPPRPRVLDGRAEAHLVALCCSDPPQGRTRWTLRLLTQELVTRRIVTQVSTETVRGVLKKRAPALAHAALVHSRAGSGALRGANGRNPRRLCGRT